MLLLLLLFGMGNRCIYHCLPSPRPARFNAQERVELRIVNELYDNSWKERKPEAVMNVYEDMQERGRKKRKRLMN